MQIYGILLNIRGILLKNRENQRNSFLNTPILCSKTYSLQILLKFLAFFLAVSDFLLTFANALKIVVIYSVKATVSPRLHAVGFFYAYKVSFSRQREKGLFNMAVA